MADYATRLIRAKFVPDNPIREGTGKCLDP